jgi:hypothetical protein
MTTVVLNRRNLLVAGGSVLATGVSGLLLPARAQGVAPWRRAFSRILARIR